MIPRGVQAFDRGYQGQSGGKAHEEIGGLTKKSIYHLSIIHLSFVYLLMLQEQIQS